MSVHTLMFGWEYPPRHLGGLGVACQGLVGGLLQHNTKVTLVLPHPHESEEDNLDVVHPTDVHFSELKEIIKVSSLINPYDSNDEYIRRLQQHMTHRPQHLEEIYGDDLYEAIHSFTEMSVAMTKNVEADVVHCHDWMTYGAGMKAAAHHSKPLVAHIHATELDRTHFSPNQWIYELERKGFEAADRIIAVSGYTKSVLVKHYGISADKISVVHNGSEDHHCHDRVWLNSEARQGQTPMVLFLGRLATQKGSWQFLDMAAQIHKIRPEVQFVIAGDGHMLGELVDRSCELGLQDCVTFAGKVNSREARQLYAKADCFVMPSLSEPFGLVALEAVAHGTPVVLSKQSGASEVVKDCFTVDFWNTSLMADCVMTILRDEPLAVQLRSQAPYILNDLTWHNQAKHVRDVYHHVIS